MSDQTWGNPSLYFSLTKRALKKAWRLPWRNEQDSRKDERIPFKSINNTSTVLHPGSTRVSIKKRTMYGRRKARCGKKHSKEPEKSIIPRCVRREIIVRLLATNFSQPMRTGSVLNDQHTLDWIQVSHFMAFSFLCCLTISTF